MSGFLFGRIFALRIAVWAIALIACGPSIARAADELDWRPRKTRVFAVGVLEFEHPEEFAPFPKAIPDRRDARLVQYFRDAGVPDEAIRFLKDGEARKKAVMSALDESLDASGPGELFVFYYAGHGYLDRAAERTYFAAYDSGQREKSGLSVNAVLDAIENKFQGDRVLLLADACHSGALNEEVARRRDRSHSYACLTSVDLRNTSTGDWTFTDSVLQALRGRAVTDYDGDGYAELDEAARFVGGELAFVDSQRSMYTVTGRFPRNAKWAKVVGLEKPGAGRHCEVLWQGKWYKSHVLEYDGRTGVSKIHYVGYDAKFDENVGSDRIRPYRPAELAVGSKVQATDDGKTWYPATIREAYYGLHRVHYDGWEASWDQWLPPKSIRAAP